jgi:hypothetical protein
MTLPTHSRLSEPGPVVRLVLERNAEALTLTIAVRPQHGARTTELRFVGVRELRFRGESTQLQEIVLLLAEDVSSQGWEGVRFRVKDYEEEFISFLCAEIEPLS